MFASIERNNVANFFLTSGLEYLSDKSEQSQLLAFAYIRQAYLTNPKDPQILERYTTVLFNFKSYENAYEVSKRWFKNAIESLNQSASANLNFIQGVSLLHLRRFDEAAERLQVAIKGFSQIGDTGKQQEAKRYFEDVLPEMKLAPQEKTMAEKKEECEIVKKFLEGGDFPEVPGKMVNIIPADWLQKWKEFNNYDQFFSSTERENQENLMEEEKKKVEWVGPIDPTSILIEDPILVDPGEEEFYTNVQVKFGLVENKDFFIVSEEGWNYLHSRYGGIPVQRPTYRKSEDSMSMSAEVWLHKINLALIPVPQKTQPNKVSRLDMIFISKNKTITDLREKLVRAYSKHFTKCTDLKSRMWKLDSEFDLQEEWNRADLRGKPIFEIQGTLIKDDIIIDEAKIADEDTLILEFKYLSDWFLKQRIDSESFTRDGGPISTFLSRDDFPSSAKKGLTGLQNLGNTCFMNSALQCLSNTFELTSYFLSNEYRRDLNPKNPLGTGGLLAQYYYELMKSMWLESSSSVSPWDVKKIIGKKCATFIGYGQQDSQELLSFLLDGLHEDLNRVKKKPVFETKDDDDRPDHIVAEESWNNHLSRNSSKIQELMNGQFKSKLDCPDCGKISITFDPFMMVSLPIPDGTNMSKFFLYFVFEDYKKIPLKITLEIASNEPLSGVLDHISSITKVKKQNMIVTMMKDLKIVEFLKSGTTASTLEKHIGIPFIYEFSDKTSLEERSTPKESDLEIENEGSSQKSKDQAMETENDIDIDNLIRANVLSESKGFYDSAKVIAFAKLIKIDPEDTYKDIHLKIFEKIRPYLHKYFGKQNQKSPINFEENSKAVLESEYREMFPEDNEGQWIYKVNLINNLKERGGKKLTCELCQKAKCSKCMLPYEDQKFSNYLEKMRVKPIEIELELSVSQKNVKIDMLSLNQCSNYDGESPEGGSGGVKKAVNLYDCFNLFTKAERLEKANAWYCSRCKDQKEALKKFDIYKLPPVLIVHLKRFKTSKVSGFSFFSSASGKKIGIPIDFPINGLDLNRYVLNGDQNAIYDLFAVSNHFGGLGGGHYTAYAKNSLNNQWYNFDDSRVSPASEKEIVSSSAYVLFYRRRENN